MKKWLLIGLCLSSVSLQAAEVRVAVAANFLATLKVLAPIYEKQSGDRLLISGASSGKLYAQILHGAPFDVMLSADRAYPEQLIQKGKAVAASRFIYAQGQLVLWSSKAMPITPESLLDESVKYIAIANPKTAPYGAAARELMEKRRLWDRVKKRIVSGESVGQAFQFVASGNAQLGFVAFSQVLNPNNRFNRTDYWLVPATEHQPLEQEAVLLTNSRNSKAAKRFLHFLAGDEASKVMKANGYL